VRWSSVETSAPQGRVWPVKLVAALAVDALRMLGDVLTVCHSAATGI
jgi:hypothetical protein